MYCSNRTCWNDIWSDIENTQQLCKEHYDEMIKKREEIKLHTPINCYCGKDHTKVTYTTKRLTPADSTLSGDKKW